jgi:hypothetical protein
MQICACDLRVKAASDVETASTKCDKALTNEANTKKKVRGTPPLVLLNIQAKHQGISHFKANSLAIPVHTLDAPWKMCVSQFVKKKRDDINVS